MRLLWLLLLTLPFAVWVLAQLPERAARRDYEAILKDGAKDTLKQWFHFFRAVERLLFVLWIAGIGAGPLLRYGLPAWGLATAGLMIAAFAWFFYHFNPTLNTLRGLDAYYVSFAPKAAYFPDRYLAREITRHYPDSTEKKRRYYAGQALRLLSRRVLLAGVVVALLLLAGAVAVLLYA